MLQCVHCRRIRPESKMTLAALPGFPFMCKRSLTCYLAGVRVRFRDPWHWRDKLRWLTREP
jgi:hypothetical protein